MNTKNTKHTWLLIAAIAIASFSLVIDSSLVKLPVWLTYVIAGVTIVLVGVFSYINRERLRGNRNSLK